MQVHYLVLPLGIGKWSLFTSLQLDRLIGNRNRSTKPLSASGKISGRTCLREVWNFIDDRILDLLRRAILGPQLGRSGAKQQKQSEVEGGNQYPGLFVEM